jgi:hypothetical protein
VKRKKLLIEICTCPSSIGLRNCNEPLTPLQGRKRLSLNHFVWTFDTKKEEK